MQSGDGLIVRVRPMAGALSLGDADALAGAARAFGNGHLDLTRRANLQIRGVREETLPPLLEALGALGLLDANAGAEAVRNVMVNPLAGIDPAEGFDMRGIARGLATGLAADPGLRALSAKFGFIADGGGVLGLDGERADIRLVAVSYESRLAIAIGLDGPNGIIWIGTAPPERVVDAALRIARAFLALELPASRGRIRDLAAAEFAEFVHAARAEVGKRGQTHGSDPKAQRSPQPHTVSTVAPRRIGAFDLGQGRHIVGISAPFGRIEAGQLELLCRALAAAGCGEVRLSPWRVLYAPVPDAATGEKILRAAKSIGLITNSADPLLRVEACTGAPSCAEAKGDTRAVARHLAEALKGASRPRRIHVSGCAKGCACSAVTDLVLVAKEGRFGVVRNGTASSSVQSYILEAALMANPAAVLDRTGAQGDV